MPAIPIDTVAMGFDWGNRGAVCLEARPGDPLNLVDDPVHYSNLKIGASGGGSASFLRNNFHQSADDPRYIPGATRVISVSNNGNVGAIGVIGTDTSGLNSGVSGINADQTGNHTLVLWYIGVNTETYDVQIQHYATADPVSTTLATFQIAGEVTPSGLMRKAVVPFTIPGTSSLRLRLRIVFPSSISSLYVYAMMFVEGTFSESDAPGFNEGTELSLYDDITSHVLSAEFNLGKTDWTALIQSENTGSVIVLNERMTPDGLIYPFSPKAPAEGDFPGTYLNPTAGFILPNTAFIFCQRDDTAGESVYNLLWTGWLKEVDVTPGTARDHKATLTLYQGLTFFERSKTSNAFIQTATGEEIVLGRLVQLLFFEGVRIPLGFGSVHLGLSPLGGTYLYDPAQVITTKPTIVSQPSWRWFNTTREDNALEVLRRLCEIENTQVYISAGGMLTLTFKNSTVQDYLEIDFGDWFDAEYKSYSDPYTIVKFNGQRVDMTEEAGVLLTGTVDFKRSDFFERDFDFNYNDGTGFPSLGKDTSLVYSFTAYDPDTRHVWPGITSSLVAVYNTPALYDYNFKYDSMASPDIVTELPYYRARIKFNGDLNNASTDNVRVDFTLTGIRVPDTPVDISGVYVDDSEFGAISGANEIQYENEYIQSQDHFDSFVASKLQRYAVQQNFISAMSHYYTLDSIPDVYTVAPPEVISNLHSRVGIDEGVTYSRFEERLEIIGFMYRYGEGKLKRTVYFGPKDEI